MRYRIITNGNNFRIQFRFLFIWFHVLEGPSDAFDYLTFTNIDSAKNKIKDMKESKRKWKPVEDQ